MKDINIMMKGGSKMRFINIVGFFPEDLDYMVNEAIRIKKETGLDEVALSLTLHPEGFPALEKPRFAAEIFREYKKKLDRTGIKVGILMQSLLGHGWPGGQTCGESWQRAVNIHGRQGMRMCLLDPGFQNYLTETIRLLAREKPCSMLVDDDMRQIDGGGLECFCPLHTARFNRLSGQHFSSDELRECVRNATAGDPLLGCFERLRTDALFETATLIRRAINMENPAIPCGYCTPGMEFGIAGTMAKLLAGETAPFLRVNNALYMEGDAKNLPFIMAYTQMFRKTYADIPEVIDESDTYPQHRYSKSARSMHAHITAGILNGLNGAKLWLTNLGWPDPETAHPYERILAAHRNFYEELERIMRGAKLKGPASLNRFGWHAWHPLSSEHMFCRRFWQREILNHIGIPARCEPEPDNGLFMLAGEDSIQFCSDGELRRLLTGPLLLDGTAAKAIAKRGFSKEIGVNPEDQPFRCSFERNRKTGERMSMMNDFQSPFLVPNDPGTEVLTDFYLAKFRESPEKELIAPGVTFFRNSLGGRIVVYAVHLESMSSNWLSPGRKRLLMDVLDRLNGTPLPWVVLEEQNVYALNAALSGDNGELLALFNLNFDPIHPMHIRVVREPKRLRKLTPEGTWADVPFKIERGNVLVADLELNTYESVILKPE